MCSNAVTATEAGLRAWRKNNLRNPDDWQQALSENDVDPDTAKSMPGFAFEFHFPAPELPITKNVISTPVAAYKHADGEWLVGLRVSDFIALAKQAGAIKGVFCPGCGGGSVIKQGFSGKMKRRYICADKSCRHSKLKFTVEK